MKRTMIPWRGGSIRPWEDLYKEVDNLVDQFFGNEGRPAGTEIFAPRMNIAETEGEYEVTVDLPGMKPEDVHVEVHDGQLTLSGSRQSEKEESGKTFHRVERHFGEFRRAIAIPLPVDESRVSAAYVDGVLHVKLPKSEKVKPTRIEVKHQPDA